MQDVIPFAVPLGGLAVQAAALVLQQRRVDTALDQRVRKHVMRAVRPYQVVRHQVPAIVIAAVDQVTQAVDVEALAKYRGRAQRQLVQPVQLVDTREHDALDRIRHGVDTALPGNQQQLFEKQRVALRALDAFHDELVAGVDEPLASRAASSARNGPRSQVMPGCSPARARQSMSTGSSSRRVVNSTSTGLLAILRTR